VCVLPLNEPNEVPDIAVSRRFHFQIATYFACSAAGVPAAQIYNPAVDGILPDPADPAKRRLFASRMPGGQLVLDNVHLSSAGHALFAEKLIDFMVARGLWTRR
jgi:lysophospholipase L1-like esterase